LLRIEEELKGASRYAGESFRKPDSKVSIVEGVSFDTIAREWRWKWSADSNKESLKLAQRELDAVLPTLKALPGLKSLQRVVCGGCLDFKIVLSFSIADYHSFEASEFAPEKSFFTALSAIPGLSSFETQTYTLMSL
jgi:hypothetical protein